MLHRLADHVQPEPECVDFGELPETGVNKLHVGHRVHVIEIIGVNIAEIDDKTLAGIENRWHLLHHSQQLGDVRWVGQEIQTNVSDIGRQRIDPTERFEDALR